MKLLIQADTNSDWDSVNFFVAEIDEATIKEIDQHIKDVKSYNSPNFYCFRFWHNFEAYIDSDDIHDFVNSNYMLLAEFEPNDLYYTAPESTLDSHTMVVTKDGFHFKCYGKHTSEEFFSESISFEEWEVIKSKL